MDNGEQLAQTGDSEFLQPSIQLKYIAAKTKNLSVAISVRHFGDPFRKGEHRELQQFNVRHLNPNRTEPF